jgi:ubiquinone/menaquinone biosynthesis C-methylase UbiE
MNEQGRTMTGDPTRNIPGGYPMPRLVFRRLIVLALTLLSVPAIAQEAAKPKAKKEPRVQKPREYKGREIAETMSFLGADWLIRESREEEERPDQMLDSLKIKPGDVVADVGAGVGYTSLRLSRRVGPEGKVLATDIQPEMIRMLRANMRTFGVKNVVPLLATQTDTKLPEGKVDLVIMVDVYHECSEPEALLQGIRKALKPGGRLVLVEYKAEDPDVPIKPEHKMSTAQARKEVEPQGFAFKEVLDFLPWQHILIFERPADDKGASKDEPAAK